MNTKPFALNFMEFTKIPNGKRCADCVHCEACVANRETFSESEVCAFEPGIFQDKWIFASDTFTLFVTAGPALIEHTRVDPDWPEVVE